MVIKRGQLGQIRTISGIIQLRGITCWTKLQSRSISPVDCRMIRVGQERLFYIN